MDEPKRRRSFRLPKPAGLEEPPQRLKPFHLRGPVRSFALGGLLGAAGTIATVRRLRRTPLRPRAAAGLAAFEAAPCFREIVEQEGHEYGSAVQEEPSDSA